VYNIRLVPACVPTIVCATLQNGGKREVAAQKASRFYPTEDVPKPLSTRKSARPTKLRSTITPGTVLVVLAGRHKGKV
jgi:large subunit ribosomal protein L6e